MAHENESGGPLNISSPSSLLSIAALDAVRPTVATTSDEQTALLDGNDPQPENYTGITMRAATKDSGLGGTWMKRVKYYVPSTQWIPNYSLSLYVLVLNLDSSIQVISVLASGAISSLASLWPACSFLRALATLRPWQD
jgi:hypothetical protein